MQKNTIEYIQSKLSQYGYIFLDQEYLGLQKKHNIQCVRCGHIRNRWVRDCIRDKQCSNCIGRSVISLQSVKERSLLNGYEFLDDYYIGLRHKHRFKCVFCLELTIKMPNHVLYKKTKCRTCVNKQRSHDRNEIIKRLKKANFELLDSEYTGSKNKHLIKCLTCGSQYRRVIYDLISKKWGREYSRGCKGNGCGYCDLCDNEKLCHVTLNSLLDNRVSLHYPIECDLKKNKKIYVDNYFTIGSTEYIVEYNGRQHYSAVKFSNLTNHEEALRIQQERDVWLEQYCRLNNIVLFTIDGRIYKDKKLVQHVTEFCERIKKGIKK